MDEGLRPEEARRAAGARDERTGRSREAFAYARRHSRRVRVLKIALPALAGLLALGFVAFSYFSAPGSIGFQLGATSVDGGRLVMDNPKLDGFTSDNRPYSMSAARASQAIGDTNRIDLEDIRARLPLDEESWVEIEAEGGTFDRRANRLDITGGMTVRTDSGISARFRSATVDIDSSTMHSDAPVEVQLDGARITADSMHVADQGSVLRFEGTVRMTIDADEVRAARAEGETQ